MKVVYASALLILSACADTTKQAGGNNDSVVVHDVPTRPMAGDTMAIVADTATYDTSSQQSLPSKQVYSNQRFKDVTVTRTDEHRFTVAGKAQVFEAAFSWVVEDGHNELIIGHDMTDAGAPAWGNFSFIVDVTKHRTNSTLHLILFEASAKDGSRQYELPVPLY